jgi:hypothetical protein
LSTRAARKSNGIKRHSKPENLLGLVLAKRTGGGDLGGDDDFMPTKKAAATKACSKPVAPAGSASRARPKAKKGPYFGRGWFS